MLLSLLSLASASYAAPAAGGFAGGAFIGAQAGYAYQNLKEVARASAITEAEATASLTALTAALKDATNWSAVDAATSTATSGLKGTEYTVVVNAADAAAVTAAAATAALTALNASTADWKAAKTFKVVFKVPVAAVAAADAAAKALAANADIVKLADVISSAAAVKALVAMDAEVKNTAHTGSFGLHVGYLAKMNQFGLGALLEGNWVISQDFKVDGSSTGRVEKDDLKTRFGANLLCRAVYFVAPSAFIGADLGVGIQEFRYKKDVNNTSTDSANKESKWLWAPMARAVVGYAVNNNLAVTLTAGGSFPIEQDWKTGSNRKVKYYNLQGNVGVSYYFGGY